VPVAAKLLTLDKALVRSHPVGSPVIQRAKLFQIAALDSGAWGNRLYVSVEDEPTGLVSSTQFLSVTNATRARVASVAGMEPGTVLELVQNDGAVLGAQVKVATVSRASGEVTFDATHALSAAQQGAAPNLKIRSREFRLSVFYYNKPDPSAPTRTEPALPAEVFRVRTTVFVSACSTARRRRKTRSRTSNSSASSSTRNMRRCITRGC
jgi:hypothetical protein